MIPTPSWANIPLHQFFERLLLVEDNQDSPENHLMVESLSNNQCQDGPQDILPQWYISFILSFLLISFFTESQSSVIPAAWADKIGCNLILSQHEVTLTLSRMYR